MNKTEKTGIVLDIQRMSTEDGPGIRTTVFLKGCTLHCTWCHNPESIKFRPEIQWIGTKCIGCGICITICPNHALKPDNGITINRTKCTGCGKCTETCPSNAMELLGKQWNTSSLVKELLKDVAYFETSNGGITVSGGECTIQADFVGSLLSELKNKGIHTAIDTCGVCNTNSLDRILPYTDLFLYDIKEIDPDLHLKYTGNSNEIVFENLKYILEYGKTHNSPKQVWIRTPLIPGRTARTDNIEGIAKFLNSLESPIIKKWELCTFNNLCRDKYKRLGISWEFENEELLDSPFVTELEQAARKTYVNPDIICSSGSTRIKGNTQPEKSTN